MEEVDPQKHLGQVKGCQQGLCGSAVGGNLELRPGWWVCPQDNMDGCFQQVRWRVLALCWSQLVSLYLDQGEGGKWCSPAIFLLEKSPNNPCPSSIHSEINKQIASCMHQVFSKLLLLCCIYVGLFTVLSLKVGNQFPLTLPAHKPADFLKFQVLNPSGFKTL